MSTRPTPVSDEVADYLLQYFSSEDEFLAQLKEEAGEQKIPEISISPEQGAFLQVFLKSMNARYVLEIGSLAGYSAITMARALPPDGKLVCLELNPEYGEFIRRKAKEAGLENVIEVVTGDAKAFLTGYKPDFEFDFVFIDAEKSGYVHYLNHSLPLLRVGGVVAGDNALAWGEIWKDEPNAPEVRHVQRFNRELISRKDMQTCMVPVGDGIAMGIKLR